MNVQLQLDVQLNVYKSRMRMLMDNLFGKTEQRSAFNAILYRPGRLITAHGSSSS